MAEEETSSRIEELKARLEADPGSRVFYQLGEELRKTGHAEEAEKVLRTGLEKHPAYLSALISLGRVLKETGRSEEAIEVLNRAFELDRQNVVVARLLGDAYEKTGDHVEAIKKYKLVAALHPADEEVQDRIQQLEVVLAGEGKLETPSGSVVPPPPPAPESQSPAVGEPGTASAEVVPVDEEGTAPEESFSFAESTAEPETGAMPPSADGESPVAGEDEIFRGESSSGTEAPEPESDPAGDLGTASADERVVDQETGSAPEEPFSFGESTADEEEGVIPPSTDGESPIAEESPESREELAAAGDDEIFGGESFAGTDAEAERDPVPDEDDVVATVTMGDLYARQGHVEQAREIYRKVLTRVPDHAVAAEKLASLDRPESAQSGADEDGSEQRPAGGRAKVQRLEAWLSKVNRS